MVIVRVKSGGSQDAADRVYIDRLANYEFAWIGAIQVKGAGVFGNSQPHFSTYDEAEADAVRWAESYGLTELTIERIDE